MDFATLGLSPALLANLESLDYRQMTAIQAHSLPAILAGRDVIAQAKTGSGKTAAFGLGLLHRLDAADFRVQSLVLCPTRELADQVARELRRLARGIPNVKVLALVGGVPIGPQTGSLEHGAHIVVGTPGRVEDHLRKGSLSLQSLRILVLDEADRMLDMGFQAAIDNIAAQLPQKRQTLLFSATYPPGIEAIAARVLRDPLRVEAETLHGAEAIAQFFYKLDDEARRLEALRLLLLHHRPGSALVFCNTREECREVAQALDQAGFVAEALHGDLEQKARDEVLVRFANRSTSVLAATDVAARGLDIEALDAVFNYRLPSAAEVYVHRIGRTGRAGESGIACSLYSPREEFKLAAIARMLGRDLLPDPLPPDSLLRIPGFKPPMATLQIDGGRKQKLRPGDILGALTGEGGISGAEVGRIHVMDNCAYVAVKRAAAAEALARLNQGKLKGRSFRARQV